MIRIVENVPTIDEYNYLTNAVGWGNRDKAIVDKALKNTLYSVCAYDDEKIIGFGRLIGDAALFLYVQDVMVISEFQGKTIGTQIMEHILNKIQEFKNFNPNIRTYLGAYKGKESFYRKFGFITRKDADLGEGMILF